MRCFRSCGRDNRCRIPQLLSERCPRRGHTAQRRATPSCVAVAA